MANNDMSVLVVVGCCVSSTNERLGKELTAVSRTVTDLVSVELDHLELFFKGVIGVVGVSRSMGHIGGRVGRQIVSEEAGDRNAVIKRTSGESFRGVIMLCDATEWISHDQTTHAVTHRCDKHGPNV